MNKEIYAIGEILTVKDDKGNPTKKFFESKGIKGSYFSPLGAGDNLKSYGFKKELDGKFITRANVKENSYLRHKKDIYHVVDVLTIRDINTVLLKKVDVKP